MTAAHESGMDIEEVKPPASAPLELLLEADPSLKRIRAYLHESRCFVARQGSKAIGVYVLAPTSPACCELMNIAVLDSYRGRGIGTKLLEHAIGVARAVGAERIEVGTGTFGYQLAFYQRLGFRAVAVDRDYFLLNYEEPIMEAGIQHKDMLRLRLALQDDPD